MNAPTNPYAAPRAPVGDIQSEARQPVRFWPPDGRIGRLRYLGYGLVLWFATVVVSAVLAVILGVAGSNDLVSLAPLLSVVLFVLVSLLLTIQRCHDVNWTGWLSVLSLVPLVNLVFGLLMLFMPGSAGANRFGAPPPANPWPVKILATLAIVVFPLGILAAIALPAYQDYVTRAQAAGRR